jgi:hypothetical protein
MSFDVIQQIFRELREDAESNPELAKAVLLSEKRDLRMNSLKPLISWLYSRLVREREWRLKAEDKLKERAKAPEPDSKK